MAASACGKDGPKLTDGGLDDANTYDAKIVDTTAPDTILDSAPAALTNVAVAHFAFHADEPATFQCKVDDGPMVACDATYDLTVTDGSHTFTVVATDTAGNVDPTPATATWVTDLTPPDTTITKSPPPIDNSLKVAFEFTSEDGVRFECALDGAAYADCTSPDTVTLATPAAHEFDVRAIDAAGNVDPTPAAYKWTIDTTTPDTQIDSGPAAFVQATSATFKYSAPAAGAGATFTCALDGAAMTSCGPSTITYDNLAEGVHTFKVAVTNAAGTTDATPATASWTVDHTAPTVQITGGPSGPTNVAAPSFPFTTAGAPTKIECQTDAGAFAACTTPYQTATLVDGAHAVTVRVTDAAGNSSTASRAFAVDTHPPTVMIVTAPPVLTAQTTAAFTFTASETPVTYACALDGGGFAPCASGKSFGSLADGAHTFAVHATDPATNTGPDATFTWTVDTVGPTVAIDTTPVDPTNATTAAFTFHSPSDGNATFECAMDSAALATCSSGVSYSSLAGGAGTSHTFHVRGKDAAGNPGAEQTFTWTVDTQAPTVAIATGPQDPTPTKLDTPTFTFTITGAPSKTECSINGAAFATCASPFTTTALDDGAYTLTVRVTDAATNSSVDTRKFTIDTVGPTVVLDTTPTNPSNDTKPIFAFHSADGGLTFECALDSSADAAFAACTSNSTSSTFTVGGNPVQQHTVYVRAYDLAKNKGNPTPYTWTVDTAGATVSIDTTPANPTNLTSATFTFSSSSDPGTATFTCALDSTTFTSCASGKSYSNLAGGAGTLHTFHVLAKDALGNAGAEKTFAWTVDTAAPTVSITSGPQDPKPTNDPMPPFGFTATFAAIDAPSKTECQIDSNGFAPCSTPFKPALALSEAAHVLTVKVTDAAGNSSTDTRAFTIDVTPPTVVLDAPLPKNPTNDPAAKFSFHSGDGGTVFECAIDSNADAAFKACTSNSATSSYTVSGNPAAIHTFYARVADAAGNKTPAMQYATYAWKVDTTPVTVTLTGNPANPTPLTSATFTWSSNKTGATFDCVLDGSSTACNAGTITYNSLGSAIHKLQVNAKDPAGNTASSSLFTWEVNTAPPAISSKVPAAWPVNYFPFAFNGPTFLTGVAAPGYVCSFNGAAFGACTSPATQTNATYGGSNNVKVAWIDANKAMSAPASVDWSPTPGLVLYYPLNNDAKNYSPLEYPTAIYNHDGSNAPTIWGGYAGGAAELTADTALKNTRLPLTSGTAYTLSFWVLPAFTAGHTIWSNVAATPTTAGCKLIDGADDLSPYVVLQCFDSTGKQVGQVQQRLTSKWSNIVIRYNGTKHGPGGGGDVLLFGTGKPTVTLANPNKEDFFPDNQLASSTFGVFPLLDEVRIYNRVFDDKTQCAITANGVLDAKGLCVQMRPTADLALDGDAQDTGSLGNVTNLVEDSGGFQDTKIGQGYYFPPPVPGIPAAALTIASSTTFAPPLAHTFTLWFNDPNGKNNKNILFSNFGKTGLIVYANPSQLTIHAEALINGNPTPLPEKTIGYSLGTWHQLVLVDTNTDTVDPNGGHHIATTKVDVYLDGSLSTTIPFPASANLWGSAGQEMVIGSSGSGSDIIVDEFKVWPADLINLGNTAGQQEAMCVLAFGGLFNVTDGSCQFP